MQVDLHLHTDYSVDAEQPQSPLDKARACQQRGLDIIGLTDHLDFHYSGTQTDNRNPEDCLRAAWAAKQAMQGQIEVLVGMELGQGHVDSLSYTDFLRTHKMDMVIGAMHVMPDDLDIYFHDFTALDCDAFLHTYFDQVLQMLRFGGFDVLAHLDYPLRVMRHGDYIPSFDHFMDRVEEVLRVVIERGYALELNAGGLRSWQKRVGPPQTVLYEYKRLGGERVSIGSDSHSLDSVGVGVADCARHAKEAGFSSVTVFRNRQPEPVPLS